MNMQHIIFAAYYIYLQHNMYKDPKIKQRNIELESVKEAKKLKIIESMMNTENLRFAHSNLEQVIQKAAQYHVKCEK